jgi:ubiquinone/menaquinone biosynthesis C-methylase UbiE
MSSQKQDHHFPLFIFDFPLRKLFNDRNQFCVYLHQGQWAADLGCGPGFYTLPMAECVGPEGKIFAVDSDEKAARAVQQKAEKKGFTNVEAHASSSAHLSFIPDGSLDFVLAHGLICCVTPSEHPRTVNEIKRILKPTGRAYLSVSSAPSSYVDGREWEEILAGFHVEKRGNPVKSGERWALVSVAG